MIALPTEPGFYRDADGDLWVIAPGSTTLRILALDGMRVTDEDAEMQHREMVICAAPFTRVRMVPADD